MPDHGRVAIRPPDGLPLPELVLASNRVLLKEAEALRAAMQQFGNPPQSGSPWGQDDEMVAEGGGLVVAVTAASR